MNISDIDNSLNVNGLNIGQKDFNQNLQAPKSGNFSDFLKNAVNEVNTTQLNAYSAMEGITTGKVANLQEAVQRIQEADGTLKLALEVKNKALNSYKEIMKMTV